MRFIGSKKNLLTDIEEMLDPHLDGNEKVFADLFSGSGVVGEYFKDKYQIISNDLMFFSFVMAKASIGLNKAPKFDSLKKIGIEDPFQYFQTIDLVDYSGGFITESYSPSGAEGRMYLTTDNAKKIDFILEKIQGWSTKEQITLDEKYYLLDALIRAVPFVSNTTGTYGAFLKNWDKRAFKTLDLKPSQILDNHEKNVVYNEDAVQLSKKITGDILYIDTPYNTRQYAPNYHVLESIARNDKPKIHGITGQRVESVAKSDFATKLNAKKVMKELLNDLSFKHVVVSYSTDGIIPENELFEIIKSASNGTVETKRIPYRKYKSKIYNDRQVFELLYYFQPQKYSPDISKGNSKVVTEDKKNVRTSTGGFIKSPLNYIGGKYKLLPQIIPLFPKDIDIFLDLFSGGGNVGINTTANHVIFNDLNTKINDLFRYFKGKNPEDIIDAIQKRISEYELSKTNEDGFLKFRKDYNDNPNPLDLYVLVSYSFNYQFRFNNDMKYNNPFGRNRSHFSERMADNLRRFVSNLNQIDSEFIDYYFNKVDTKSLTEKSFVYADPPYLITTGSYNDGNRGFVNWTEKQEKELLSFLDELNDRNIKFALSNVIEHKGKTNEILKKWSQKYKVHHLDFKYNNSSYNTNRLGSDEVLITNY